MIQVRLGENVKKKKLKKQSLEKLYKMQTKMFENKTIPKRYKKTQNEKKIQKKINRSYKMKKKY